MTKKIKKIDIEKCVEFVAKKHESQRWGEFPYTEHLRRVALTVSKWAPRVGFSLEDGVLEACGWLHDVLEDTPTTRSELTETFCLEVSEIVWCVTDEPGKNRKERKRLTYPKIRSNEKATFIKLCDRLVNVEKAAEEANGNFLSLYKKEHYEFTRALRREGEFIELWTELDLYLGN